MPLRGWWRWLCQVFVCEHGEGGGDGANDPEGADQVSEHVSDDYDVHREIDDCERTGEGKGPGSPGGDEAQPTKHDADKHGARQVADDVDEQVDEHDGVAVEVRPERSELRCAAGLGDIVGQGVPIKCKVLPVGPAMVLVTIGPAMVLFKTTGCGFSGHARM